MESSSSSSSSEPPRLSAVSFIFSFLKKDALLFGTIQILSLAWAVDQVVFPMFFSKIIDGLANYAGERSLAWSYMSVPIFSAVLLWLVIECSFRTAGFLSAHAFPRLESNIRMALYESVLARPYSFFSSSMIGDISNKIAAVPESVTRALVVFMTFFMPACFALCITCTTFFFISPLFTCMVITWALCHVTICIIRARRCMLLSQEHTEKKHQLQGKIVDSISNYMAITTYTKKAYEAKIMGSAQISEVEKNQQQLVYTEAIKILLGFLTLTVPGFCINGYAYYCWSAHLLSVGEVVLIFSTTWNLVAMVWWSGMEIPTFFKELGIVRQSLSLVQSPPLNTGGLSLEMKEGNIIFSKLTFRYEKTLPLIFKDFSLSIKGGQKVGLVGESGSGKTTLALLLMRLFEPEQGEIYIDQQALSKVSVESLREHIAFIPQEPLLFHRSIAHNISYARPEATQKEIVAAAKKAHAHEFISSLPQGYDTVIGDRGFKLSGGQRQRVAIARAILRDASIIIFDEATSALDTLTEQEIQNSLYTHCENKTLIVIAHRLSTLHYMDRILVLGHGSIIEDGNHIELLGKGGAYSDLWNAGKAPLSYKNLLSEKNS